MAEGTFECTQTCGSYIQNAGEHYQAIMDRCIDLCVNNFGVVATGVSEGLKKGLEVGLVVLVILLVITGLIIGFSKLRKEGDDDDDDGGYDYEGGNRNKGEKIYY